ncbi:MAG: FAD-binding and (Fe-S)-binding domain-containing protein [Longimicrobiales bacterium]
MKQASDRGLERALARALEGDVLFDAYTRHLFSTDASMYAIEPIGVVLPRHAGDVMAAIAIASEFDVPLLPRGAGTSLGGQTVGHAVVLDFSRYMHELVAIDGDAGTARVQPGLVQDDLNLAAQKYGLWFAPDTSTSNRATLGGMIGNNSCGARSARYGMTIDHVDSLDAILADGSRVRLQHMTPEEVQARARGNTLEAQLYREIPQLVRGAEHAIRTGFPPHWRRSGGYRLDRLLPEHGPLDLSKLVVGSEGTLAVVVEATVRLVPRPGAVSALAGHFSSVAAAIDAVADARACEAAAIELVDREILGLARRSPIHGHLAASLEGEPGALLWVEFHADSTAEASAASARLGAMWKKNGHGYAVVRAETHTQLDRFRALRRAGLGLLMAAGQGRERSLAFVEDTAVDPDRLPEYTERFVAILARHNLRAGFYGHASAGCLHIRPFLDLARPGAVDVMREVAEEVCELVVEFGGMNSSEHGDGLVRAEFSRRLFGDALYEAMRHVKRIFDPNGRLNPGKKVDAPRMTENLRDPALPRALAVMTHLDFGGPEGMHALANRCARIGACRRSPDSGGTMCPSFMATRDERHSTRGRANALVKALSSPDPRAALGDDALHEILDLCLECKACKTECPLSVDMAALKAEVLSHRHEIHGVPLRARLFAHARTVNRIGSFLAPVSNLASTPALRGLGERITGIDRRRPLPRFHRMTLKRWFARRSENGPLRTTRVGTTAPRGEVIVLADSFTSYTEPHIGMAGIELLERAGWRVRLVSDVCCGRTFLSKGMLADAKARLAALVDRLAPAAQDGTPIVGFEPSCVFTLKDELRSLLPGVAGVDAIAEQAGLVDALLVHAIDDGGLRFPAPSGPPATVLFHPHCHQKAALAVADSVALLERIPGAQVRVLDAGCCGMAGSFGFEREHYELSMTIGGQRLFPAIRGAPPGAFFAATGVSCRQQIAHGTGRHAEHPVVLTHEAITAR